MIDLSKRHVLNLDGFPIWTPETPVASHEQVVCVVPEALRPLWSYVVAVNDAHTQLHKNLVRDEMALHSHLHCTRDYATRLFGERLVDILGRSVFEMSPDTLAVSPISYGIRADWHVARWSITELLAARTPHLLDDDWLTVYALEWNVMIPRQDLSPYDTGHVDSH